MQQRIEQVRIAGRRHLHLALRAAQGCIIASGHNDQLGLIFHGHRQQQLLKDGQVIAVAHALGIQRDVEVVASAGSGADGMIIRLLEIRPKAAVLIPMYGEIQNSTKHGERGGEFLLEIKDIYNH